MHTQPVYFITGSNSGLGRSLAHAVLEKGLRAVLTARQPDTLQEFAERYPEQVCVVRLDVTRPDTITEAVKTGMDTFGGIDVLVNNAGHGYLSAIEEGEDEGIRDQFETNFFGVISVCKAILPIFRRQRKGHIVNISSLGGLVAFAGTGYYHASKFALEGLSESLWHEVSPLGIDVTIVEPAAFRTDWAGRSMKQSAVLIDDYDGTAGSRRTSTLDSSGQQPGDPARAAQAIIEAVNHPTPPLRLLLGKLAYQVASNRLTNMQQQFDTWQHVTQSADYPEQRNTSIEDADRASTHGSARRWPRSKRLSSPI